MLSTIDRLNVFAEEEEGSEEGDQLQEPLLMGLNSDDEGSVGSEDSTDYDTEDESMPPPISKQPLLQIPSFSQPGKCLRETTGGLECSLHLQANCGLLMPIQAAS